MNFSREFTPQAEETNGALLLWFGARMLSFSQSNGLRVLGMDIYIYYIY